MNSLLVLGLTVGGVYLATRKPKRKKKKTAGDYPIKIDEEIVLQLPRASGFWRVTPIAPSTAHVRVYVKPGDPLDVARVMGDSDGAVKVQFYADEGRTDLVSEYMFQVS